MVKVAIIAPGSMGAAVGARLTEHGVSVLTSLQRRSVASAERAAGAGMAPASEAEIAASDLILSIVPPGVALALAERLAPALRQARAKPVYVDCNAVSPDTVRRIEAIVRDAGTPFVDAGIIGGPPRGSYTPSIYASGTDAGRFAALADHGLVIRCLDGPVGAASALKMAYAGITKGTLAVGTAMLLAAHRHGVGPALRAELADSQSEALKRFRRMLPGTYSKAYRWVAEMEEIADFGGTSAPGIGELYQGIADLYQAIAQDADGDRQLIAALEEVLDLASSPDE